MSDQNEPSGLSGAAVAAWRDLLAQPMPPSHLAEYADCLSRVMGDAFITSPGSTWARESHLGARFAKAVSARSVWLQDKPDLKLVGADGVQRQYELTEALEPNRRRNQEYREDREKLKMGKSAARLRPLDNVNSTRKTLRKAAAEKVDKAGKYGNKPTGLVIYLNTDLHPYQDCVSLLETSLHRETSPAAQKFCEIWVLWSTRLYLVWRDGKPEPLQPLVAD